MAKIHEKSKGYAALRCHVDTLFKLSYRRVEYYGKEKLPKDGTIIYAPNHTNTLMDALAVLSINRIRKVFVARADVFKNPIALKILTFLKMLPINRKRDGVDSLTKNEEINDTVVEVLQNKVPFCILPEGRHRAMHSLLPLQKGLFRIALQANDTFGKDMPVYIVPVGLSFGHFFRYRSSLLLQIGEPINVTEFVNTSSHLTQPEQINYLRDELASRLKKVILHIEDNDNYNATIELCHINSKTQQKHLGLKRNTLLNRFLSAKETVRNIEESLEINPSKTQELLQEVNDFSVKRHKSKIGIESFLNPHINLSILGRFLVLVLGLPYFVISSVATAPVTLLSVWICSKIKDKAFHNTLRYMVWLILLPLFLLILTVVVGLTTSLLWMGIVLLLFLPSFYFLHEYLRFLRLFISDIKWKFHPSLHKQLSEIRNTWNKLNEVV